MLSPMPAPPRSHRRIATAFAIVLVAAVAATAVATAATPAPKMADEDSYDALTYSAWGRRNHLSGATCTGLGPAGKVLLGPTHGSFRCEVQVGEVPAGTVVAKVLGPESLHVTSVSGGKLGRDQGIGAVPSGSPTMKSFEAVMALQDGAWARSRKVTRVLCHGVGAYRPSSTSASFYAFDCATFDSRGTRGAQVLVTAAGASAVKVVRTLAP